MNEEFHKARKDWGRIKHLILEKYINLFVGKLGRFNPRIYYVDGFAGQGIYGDSAIGSAFIGAETATSPVQKSRRGFLRCINVEESRDTFAELEKNLARHAASGQVRNLFGSFQENLPEILRTVGNDPAFFFIDPFGSQGIEISTLTAIRKGRDRSEILVRYDDTRVKRLLSWAVNNADNFKESHRKIAVGYAKRVAQLTDADAIRELDQAEGDRGLTREILINGYMNAVKRSAHYQYALHYPIKNPRTGGHKYYLVHFCNHPDGYHYMASFMARAERAYEDAMRQSQTDEFFAEAKVVQDVMPGILEDADKSVEDSRVAELGAALPEILRSIGQVEIANRYLYAAIVARFGWKLTRKEWIRALRNAHHAGLLNYVNSDDGEMSVVAGNSPRLLFEKP